MLHDFPGHDHGDGVVRLVSSLVLDHWPTTGSGTVVAVPCAIAGAASFGLASAVQQRAANDLPQGLDPRLLVRLIRNPIWGVGVLTVGLGLSLQMVALAFGPLALVQPLGVTSALFGAMFAGWMARRRLDRLVVFAALACAAGLSVFLLLARPTEQAAEYRVGRSELIVAVVFAVALLVALLMAKSFTGEIRALALALASGVFYGVTAGLIKVVVEQIRIGGLSAPFGHWTLYLACVLGPPGFLLSQHAFQQDRQISLALAVITTVDPLVAIVVGVTWLGERVVSTPAALAGEALGVLAIVGGVALLAQRGERLRQAETRRSRESTAGYP